MDNWRLMSDAPKDGTRVIGYGKLGFESGDGIGTVAFVGGKWICSPSEATEYDEKECHLLAWQPLPDPSPFVLKA